MLQVKNLVKIYYPKKGVPVKALDNVSLKFPETGMVFLLGKSGSGKSTLLNILGGLDRYNSGDITILGKSTTHFNQSHFDSYRNTYVGFIFQEYNILEEFSVGTNIALALQLQGIKPTSSQINQILRDVDLAGYGVRKPNELSGGQKQRVAIARALVKNPKIIMADEPTGALDSATGRQVLNTLKKLSQDKLVIVVSHDREFAEQYADRIIELADGRVIRDIERLQSTAYQGNVVPVYMEDSISLPEDYQLTQADKDAINSYVQKMINLRKAPRFTLFSRQQSAFQPTDESRISTPRNGYKLIKSRLPLKYAFKLGASGLKYKKFRLVMTILLSCIALGLFGLANTVSSYDYATTAYSSLTSNTDLVNYAAFEKEVDNDAEGMWGHSYMSQDDLELIRQETGLDPRPVYSANVYMGNHFPMEMSYSSYYMTEFSGAIPVDQEFLNSMGASIVAGRLPETANEIAISVHALQSFQYYGYSTYDPQTGEMSASVDIHTAEDIIGKTLDSEGLQYIICGVVETGLDTSRYQDLLNINPEASFTESLLTMALQTELEYARRYSLAGLLMVNDQFLDNIHVQNMAYDLSSVSAIYLQNNVHYNGYSPRLYSASPISDQVIWLDGKARTELAENEVVVSRDTYWQLTAPLHDEEWQEEYDFVWLRDNNLSYDSILALDFVFEIVEPEFYMNYDFSQLEGQYSMKIVGIVDSENWCYYLPDKFQASNTPDNILQTLSPMPEDPQQLRQVVDFSAKDLDPSDDNVITYNLMNQISFELKSLNQVFEIMSQVFFWVGLVFVIFASLLFSNFIATSISYKKQEIGILRAIGSRSSDVFRIFFAESFIIAMINFVLSYGGTFLVAWLINSLLKNSTGLLLTILNVGPLQGILILAICLLSAFVASWLPVYRIASKRPIDAIRDR